jgi:signal transduction histidine kinase
LYYVYNSQKEYIFHKQYQILQQVIYESDNILKECEEVGVYLQKSYKNKQHTILDDIIHLQKNINTILILDNKGILKDFTLVQKINIYKGFDYSNMEYFKALTPTKNEHWTDVFLSTTTNHPSVAYSKRLDKDTIAIFIIDLNSLNSYTAKFKSQDGSTMVRIVDQNGIFVAHPARPKLVAQRKNIKNTTLYKQYISKDFENKQIIFTNSLFQKSIGIYGVTKQLKWTIVIKEKYQVVFKTITTLIWFIIYFMLALIALSVFASLKLSKSILKPLDALNKKMNDIANGKSIEKIKNTNYKELKTVSSNFLIMQDKIKQREELNRQKDQQLYESAKMAQMGEMIGNIAHQWRQPLSVISTSASGMKMEKEFALLDDEKFYTYCDGIVNQTQFLSKTIDTFRNFIKEKKEVAEVILQDDIDSVLHILETSLHNNYIKIVNNINYRNKIKITMIQGELSQVIINIFNNAKDILLEKKIEEPYIQIDCIIEKHKAIITIQDNGGGIPKNIISKIFDPYFTTKHKSQGTGLGLHMSYKIITNSLKGKLYVKNTDIGAKFYIELPLS